MPSVNRTVLELRDLANSAGTDEEILDSHISTFTHPETDEDGQAFITYEVIKRGEMCKKPANRQYTQSKITILTNANDASKQHASQQKKLVAEEWIKVLKQRFADFENDIFKETSWLDRATWEYESTGTKIINLSTHFDVPLNYAGFDINAVIKEWKSCQRYVATQFTNPETENAIIWRYFNKKEGWISRSLLAAHTRIFYFRVKLYSREVF